MLFDPDLLKFIANNPIEGLVKVCNFAKQSLSTGNNFTDEDFEILLESYALISEVIDSNGLADSINLPNLSSSDISNPRHLLDYIDIVFSRFENESIKLKLEALKSSYKSAIGSGFFYEFSQGDIDRIQILVSELREQISSSNKIETDHKSRLLKRLEKLQSEIHKKVSDLDRFWGLIGDAGVVLGKFGTDAKPFVDRIKEIADIVWRTQSRKEELPSNTPCPTIISTEKNGE
mgnify:CR=1 FL=1